MSLFLVGTGPMSRLKIRVRFSASQSTCLTLHLVRSSSEGVGAGAGGDFAGRLLVLGMAPEGWLMAGGLLPLVGAAE